MGVTDSVPFLNHFTARRSVFSCMFWHRYLSLSLLSSKSVIVNSLLSLVSRDHLHIVSL